MSSFRNKDGENDKESMKKKSGQQKKGKKAVVGC